MGATTDVASLLLMVAGSLTVLATTVVAWLLLLVAGSLTVLVLSFWGDDG